MEHTTDSPGVTDGEKLTISRTFDAPRELVFKVWTDPEHVKQWWGPHNFTMPVCEIDPRPEGVFDYCMRSPEGLDFWCKGFYREVVEPELLVFTGDVHDENEIVVMEVLTTVTLEEQDSKTLLTMRTEVLSTTDKAAPYLAGMEEGWKQTLDRLSAHLTRA